MESKIRTFILLKDTPMAKKGSKYINCQSHNFDFYFLDGDFRARSIYHYNDIVTNPKWFKEERTTHTPN